MYIPSKITECGIHAPGDVKTITPNFLFQSLALFPLCDRPSGSESAHGRGMKYKPNSYGNFSLRADTTGEDQPT